MGDLRGREMAKAKEAVTNPRVTAKASELGPWNRYCTCCKKPLAGKLAWLELDQRNQTYHDFGGVPDDRSQGWFPFGMTCARNKIAEARQKQICACAA